ncbi:MAG: hypothetical protein ACKOJ9_10180 [Actinomycetota bacterium]
MKRAVVALSLIALVGCSTSTSDYEREAEKFLESADLAEEAGYRYSDADCETPTVTITGTQFTCSATDNDGDVWSFVAEITGDREVTIVSGQVEG